MPFTAQKIIRLDTVESTNLFAQDLLLNHEVENGTVIVSRNQTKGRGQRGSIWIAEAGTNLTFTIILFPEKLVAEKQFLLNKAFCLAVHDFLKSYNFTNVAIKWPNDVLVKGKKISGMLVENSLKGEYLSTVVAGFGINVNQTNLAASLIDIATSMRLEKAQVFDLEETFSTVLHHIDVRYHEAVNNQQAIIDADYNKALFQLNEWCIYEANNKEFIGCIRGVTETGQLIIEHQGGTKQLFSNKEVRFKIFN